MFNVEIHEHADGHRARVVSANGIVFNTDRHGTKKGAYDAAVSELMTRLLARIDELTVRKVSANALCLVAKQWFGDRLEGIREWPDDRSTYHGQEIRKGDWIVDGHVYTPEQFTRRFT